ncbi:OLC1v1035700C2 [Oldenlandia corymbosa var. corymbosa]|nr:OLC1v1035700C2 [Oldenlandia corymbosa var. corymbosa]
MAPKKMTEYERKRLENIKRNEEMLAALKVHSKLSQLSEATKRQKAQTKSYKISPSKKQKTETPIILRRSLRTRGVAPDADTAGGLKDDFNENQKSMSKKNPSSDSDSAVVKRASEKGPITMTDAYRTEASDRKLIQAIWHCSRESGTNGGNEGPEVSSDVIRRKEENEGLGDPKSWKKVWGSIDVEAMNLEPENVARIVPGRILNVKFLPTRDARIVVVGNKFGDIGFWNVDADDEETEGIYLYHPHPAPVSGIVVNPFSLTKMFTSCYNGFIRMLDFEKELFDLVYASEHAIYSMSQKSDDPKSIYFCEGSGGLSLWDMRTGKLSHSWDLHHSRINSIDFNSCDTNIMATSSTDGSACIWDLRTIGANGPSSLKIINHERAVHSAYFSPSGKFLATTSADDIVGLLSGDNYEKMTMVYHNNQTGRWISSFR